MTWLEILSIIINVLLGGGIWLTLVTLKSVKQKASAEAKGADADAKSKEIDNNEKILKLNQEYVVEPLKREIARFSRVVTRFEKAFEKINDCEYKVDCPVRKELQKKEEEQ